MSNDMLETLISEADPEVQELITGLKVSIEKLAKHSAVLGAAIASDDPDWAKESWDSLPDYLKELIDKQ